MALMGPSKMSDLSHSVGVESTLRMLVIMGVGAAAHVAEVARSPRSGGDRLLALRRRRRVAVRLACGAAGC
jgi:hypothetical protein